MKDTAKMHQIQQMIHTILRLRTPDLLFFPYQLLRILYKQRNGHLSFQFAVIGVSLYQGSLNTVCLVSLRFL